MCPDEFYGDIHAAVQWKVREREGAAASVGPFLVGKATPRDGLSCQCQLLFLVGVDVSTVSDGDGRNQGP